MRTLPHITRLGHKVYNPIYARKDVNLFFRGQHEDERTPEQWARDCQKKGHTKVVIDRYHRD